MNDAQTTHLGKKWIAFTSLGNQAGSNQTHYSYNINTA